MSHQFGRELPEPRVGFLFLRVFGDAVQAREDADDVAIEDGRGLVEGDAADGTRRVTPDAGQREDGIKFFWEFGGNDVSVRGAFSS